MCGILAYYSNTPIEKILFTSGLQLLEHRGPDGYGIQSFRNNTVHLGHRRLAILDLSKNGDQPMTYNNLSIIFNGEIFNYLEIKEDLKKLGYNFNTTSDTEVILKAYVHWGETCVEQFNGMWAFAIYDTEQNSLFLSRDRFGIKPLYYLSENDTFIISSEIRVFENFPNKQVSYNNTILEQISQGSFAWHAGDQTWLKGVKSIPAGHNAIVKNGLTRINKWYNLNKAETPKTFDEQAEVLRALIIDAIKIRLRSDVSIGTCLSGGVDSGSIVSTINHMELNGDQFDHYQHKSFCASFPNSQIDESTLAKRLAEQLDLRLDIKTINPPSEKELEHAMLKCDGPMHSLAFFPISELYSYIADQGIKVTLDGQGPDEMLGGYDSLHYALRGSLQAKNPRYFLDLVQTYSKIAPSGDHWIQALNTIILEGKNIVKNTTGIGTPTIPWKQSGPDFIKNVFDRNLHFQFFKQPLPAILQQFDRSSMAYGVECRMPFMDYRIVEFIFSLDTESKVGHGYTKRILRHAMKGIFPDFIRLNKTKIGFNAPIVEWFRGPLKEWTMDNMNSQEFLDSQFFDGQTLLNDYESALKNHQLSWDHAWKLWGPLHINWWINRK